jgi:hypothetical protein
MLKNNSSITRRALFGAFFAIILLLPLTVSAQSLIIVRPRRRHVMVYRQPRVIYQRPYYTSSYYSNPYYNYGYTQPYYGTSYYSSNYAQPYYVNPYAYSAVPTYSYGYTTYRPRYRRSRVRFGIYLR